MSYKVEVLAYGEREYASNGLRFATEEEAGHYAADLFCRWLGAKEYRVVESEEPTNYAWDEDEGLVGVKNEL